MKSKLYLLPLLLMVGCAPLQEVGKSIGDFFSSPEGKDATQQTAEGAAEMAGGNPMGIVKILGGVGVFLAFIFRKPLVAGAKKVVGK